MRSLTVVIAFAAAGLVGALAGEILSTDPEAPVSGAEGALEERIDRLERQVAQLRLELRDLRDTLALQSPSALPAPAATPSAVSPDDAPAAAVSEFSGDEAFEARVREVVDARERENRAERERRGIDFAIQAEERVLARLGEAAGLGDYEKQELSAILARRRKAMTEFRESLSGDRSDTVDRAARREEMRGIRQAAETEIKTLLTEEQYEAYRKLESRRGGNSRREPGRTRRR